MNAPFAPDSLAAGLTAALDWWREAGVDCDFLDDPRDWLPAPEAAQDAPRPPIIAKLAPPPEPEKPKIGGDPAGWPKTLDEFAAWWMAEPLLDGGRVSDRVPPRGPVGTRLMVIVPQPEADDPQSERLLSGREGRLLAAMLPAMGLSEADIYIASALPRPMPEPDWADLRAQGLGAVLSHHIALAAPQRVLAFGKHILPLLDNAISQSPAHLPEINQGSAGLAADKSPAMEALDLGVMLDHPKRKQGFWRNWLGWTE